MPFTQAEAIKRPNLYQVGRLVEFSEPKLTDSQVYYNCRFKLQSFAGNGMDTGGNFMFRPEWFQAGFRIEKPSDDASGQEKGLYSNWIRLVGRKGQIGIIEGLAGSEENAKRVHAILETYDGSAGPEALYSALYPIYMAAPQVGYMMKQEYKKAEGGLTNKMQFEAFFYPTEKELTRLAASAKKAPDKYSVRFDGVPF